MPITIEKLRELTAAQVRHTGDLCNNDHWEHSDDGFDYLQSALRLALKMTELDFNQDVKGFERLRKKIDDYASDGVCEELEEYR